jgi:hypothetical protein
MPGVLGDGAEEVLSDAIRALAVFVVREMEAERAAATTGRQLPSTPLTDKVRSWRVLHCPRARSRVIDANTARSVHSSNMQATQGMTLVHFAGVLPLRLAYIDPAVLAVPLWLYRVALRRRRRRRCTRSR